jgi:3-deoxy-D-manno-octulosonate 8-phosphate phosphatase (KDO 8-P phosphatase)
VCKNNGGNGAVREMIEYILKAENKEDAIREIWL